MTEPKKNPSDLMWKLGLSLTVPWIPLSGPLAGYLIGQLVLVKRLAMPPITTPVLMLLGLVASGVQTYRLINKLRDTQTKISNR